MQQRKQRHRIQSNFENSLAEFLAQRLNRPFLRGQFLFPLRPASTLKGKPPEAEYEKRLVPLQQASQLSYLSFDFSAYFQLVTRVDDGVSNEQLTVV